jgi:hypothetical protein
VSCGASALSREEGFEEKEEEETAGLSVSNV